MMRLAVRVGLGLALVIPGAPAFAAVIAWTDWTTATGFGGLGSATGTIMLPGLGPVEVTYSGLVSIPTQTSGGVDYWVPEATYRSAGVDNAPSSTDVIALDSSSVLSNTLTFSIPLVDPVMALLSLGNAGLAVTYSFDVPFDVLSFGPGYWSLGGPGTLVELPGNQLQGMEGNGLIQFHGTVSSISWTASPSESWQGFTVGAAPLPEPTASLLIGTGLLGLAMRRRLRTR